MRKRIYIFPADEAAQRQMAIRLAFAVIVLAAVFTVLLFIVP
jgi:hypothetical protein